jgi:branched-chain amino acid transport system permease protein
MIRRVWISALGSTACIVALALVAPLLARYTLDVGATLLIYLAATQAWNLLAGLAGQLSLGVSAFLGTGAYTVALLMAHLGMSPGVALLGAAVGATALSGVLAPALLRLRGDHFTIGSLAAALAVQAWAVNSSLLGGSAGLDLPLDQVPAGVGLFRWALLVAAVATLCSMGVAASAFGLKLLAVREQPEAATGLGVNVFRLRLMVILLSSLLTGLAGGVFALQQVHLEPTGSFGVSWTINVVLMTIIGGAGTLIGPVVGTVLVYYGLTQQLSAQPILGPIIEGIVLIAVVRFAPRGLWPLVVDRAPTTTARLRRVSFFRAK